MVISKNSQLGLMLWDQQMMLEYLQDSKTAIERERKILNGEIKVIEQQIESGAKEFVLSDSAESIEIWSGIQERLGYNKNNKGAEFYTIPHPKPFYYLIMPSVDTCAEMIKIRENFACSIFGKIKDGEHVYLLGKSEFFRFVKFNGAIRGSYWNRNDRIAFEIGMLIDKDQYYFATEFSIQFSRIIRLMTFIELGDIEVIYLEKGRNNGKSKNDGKITNTSDYNVYVVDASWNKLIIRTDGFAVRGHFRLQPCGANMADRKLIWIDAFEKHGYRRQPRAKIIQ
jgi:hypothetical protein